MKRSDQLALETPVDATGTDGSDDPLDAVVWFIGRAYYAYIGLLGRVLAQSGLDEHLRPGMGPILFALFEADGRSIKDISVRVQLSHSTLTGLLARMESAGLVQRRRDGDDGRVVRVQLTPLGRSLEPRCRRVLRELSEVLRSGMGAGDVGRTRDLLQKMTDTLRSEERRRVNTRRRKETP